MRFSLNLTCENDAFQPEPNAEVARILREVATRIENGESVDHYRTIFDANGNDVGRFKLAKVL